MSGLVGKASAAAASARLLFDAGDFDGCVNRAYYAMFDAARAYLKLRHGIELAKIKTHTGVLIHFDRHAVGSGDFPQELSRSLNKAIGRRAQADYDELTVEKEAAERTLQEMAVFVDAIVRFLEERRS